MRNRRPRTAVPWWLALVLASGLMALLPLRRAVADDAKGLRLDITMREIANTDPPESEVIDTLSANLAFGLETTLRVGNAVAYMTAQPLPDSRVKLEYSVFVPGPIPDQHADEAVVEYGIPLIIDGIKGKGKSTYRMLIVPHPADSVTEGHPMPGDDSGWEVIPSAYYHFYLARESRAMFHFPEFRNALEYEYEAVHDTLDFEGTMRVNYYFFEGNCTDFPFDPRFDFAVDPSRNRIVARYDRYYTGVDVQAMLLLNIYRWWGYAPELLAVGASGYLSFADYFVLLDRASGQSIPLSKLARTIDFKRQPFPASYHHAASFARWLMVTHGHDKFRDFYSKATDLSLERALWAVYEKTLAELETEWLAYLKGRKFTVAEYYTYAKRAAAYHNYAEYYDLLRHSVAIADSIPPFVSQELALAAAQLGRWDESLEYVRASAKMAPQDPDVRNLLTETLWASGDTNACQYQLLRLVEKDPNDARPYVLLGDLQEAWRRNDSAAALWSAGLDKSGAVGPIALELQLRLGRFERRHRHADSARALFTSALHNAYGLMDKMSASPRALVRLGECLMELDSTASALSYLGIAAYVADAPQELGRTYLNIGRCYDLEGDRPNALQAYETVLKLPATHYDAGAAHFYMNHIYAH